MTEEVPKLRCFFCGIIGYEEGILSQVPDSVTDEILLVCTDCEKKVTIPVEGQR